MSDNGDDDGTQQSPQFERGFWGWISVCGASLGWVTGLSNAAIITSIVTPLLATIVSLLSIAAGLTIAGNSVQITKFSPVALFLFFFAAFVPLGVFVRANDFLLLEENRDGDGSGTGVLLLSLSSSSCETLSSLEFGAATAELNNLNDVDDTTLLALDAAAQDEEHFNRLLYVLCRD